MKKLFTVILIAASLSTAAQGNKETMPFVEPIKKDTVVVALFEKSDTVAVRYMAANPRGYVRLENGYAILKGFVDAKGKPAQQPKVVAVLDRKKKPVKQVIQIL